MVRTVLFSPPASLKKYYVAKQQIIACQTVVYNVLSLAYVNITKAIMLDKSGQQSDNKSSG